MKQKVKLPLYSIYSLIQDMEKMGNDPKMAEKYKSMQAALSVLKDTFMPLINEYKDCCNMPDIDAEFDTENGGENDEKKERDERRFELIKSAIQGRLAAIDPRFGFQRSLVRNVAKEAILMADVMLEELEKSPKPLAETRNAEIS